MAINLRAHWKPYAVFGGVALLVLAPLLRPGFVLALDMTFTPKLRMPDEVTSSYLLHVLLHVVNFIVPGDVLGKMILFVAFMAAGTGMYRLAKVLLPEQHDTPYEIGAYFAGLLYAANPFTYDRFMTGQYNVLLGYALLPFFAHALLRFVRAPHLRSGMWVAVWATVIGIVSIHTLGLVTLLSVIATGFYAWQRRAHPHYLRVLAKWSVASLALFVIASSYWLAPLMVGKGSTAHEIASFTSRDAQAFATVGGNALGKFGNIIRLQGFWAEDRGLYTLPQERVAGWGMVMLLLWLAVIGGSISAWRSKQYFVVVWSGLSIGCAAIIAVGFGNGWLGAHVPFFAGYREPQKFVGLVAFGYALLSAWGIATILRYCIGETGRKATLVGGALVMLLVPVILSSTLWWGGNGQLQAQQYPEDWTAANQLLSADHDDFQTLFLPWHLYMYFGFAGRIVGNPAEAFFDKPVIVSDDPEFRGVAPIDSSETKQKIGKILSRGPTQHDLGKQLAALDVKYILLAKDSDYRAYHYLGAQPELELVQHGTTLDVYRNNAFGKEQ